MKNEQIEQLIAKSLERAQRREFDILKTWPVVVFFVGIVFHAGAMWYNVGRLGDDLRGVVEQSLRVHERLTDRIDAADTRMTDHLSWEFGARKVSEADLVGLPP